VHLSDQSFVKWRFRRKNPITIEVSDAFSVSLLENAPEKCALKNHAPRLRLKMNSITTQKSAPESGHPSPVYKGSRLSKRQGYLLVTYLFYGCFVVQRNRPRNFLSTGTQDVARRQLRCTQNSAQNFLFASDQNHTKTHTCIIQLHSHLLSALSCCRVSLLL